MTESSQYEQPIPSPYAELRARLAAVLAAPLPQTNAERHALLERHLRECVADRGDSPAPDLTASPDDLAQAVRSVRAVVDDLSASTGGGTRDWSGCDTAVVEGVALISAGSLLGPHAALVGFGIGVYLLTQHCGEGS